MRRPLFAASIAVAALVPSIAYAQSNCERQRSNQVVGTVAGAGVGAVIGNSVAGRGDRALGTVIGAIGGAMVGNQVARPNADCRHAYGYYDRANRWHATGVSTSDARGYYDRDGGWVDGAPNGHYGEGNRWIANSQMTGDDGAYGAQGEWVPASVDGYYDRNDQWVAGVATGHYEMRGHWVPGVATGHYDERGSWIAGAASGHRDASGMWIADPQLGYYDTEGRWLPGSASGYYDSRGRWFATPARAPWQEHQMAPQRDILVQVTAIEDYVRSAPRRRLSRAEANGALQELGLIRSSEARLRGGRGGYRADQAEVELQTRLDRLTVRLRITAQ